MIEQHSVLRFRIDFYLPDYKLAVEIDGKGHMDRNETEKEKKIIEDLKCTFIKINSDSENFDIHAKTDKIFGHINEVNKKLFEKETKTLVEETRKSVEKQTKNSLIDIVSRDLSEMVLGIASVFGYNPIVIYLKNIVKDIVKKYCQHVDILFKMKL